MFKSSSNFSTLKRLYHDFKQILDEVQKLSPLVENIEKKLLEKGRMDDPDLISMLGVENLGKSSQADEEYSFTRAVTFEKDLFDMFSDTSTASISEKEAIIHDNTPTSSPESSDFNCANEGEDLDKNEEIQRDTNIAKQSKKICKSTKEKSEKYLSKKQERARNRQRRDLWKLSEDSLVLQLISNHGLKWSRIASFLPGRTGKQVRDRYLNNLKPNIKHDDWTSEEDDLFISLYHKFGNKWCKIASQMPGRTESQAKNRFYAHIKQRMEDSYKKATSHTNNNSVNTETVEVVVQSTMQTDSSECEDESQKMILVEEDVKSNFQLQQEMSEQELLLLLEEEKASPSKRCRTLSKQSKIIDPACFIAFDEIIDFSEVIDANNDYFKLDNYLQEEQSLFDFR